MAEVRPINKKLLTGAFLLYVILLAWFILFRANVPEFCGKYRGIELVPFADKDNYVSATAKYLTQIGNVVLFIPAGLYFPLFLRQSRWPIRVAGSFALVLLLSLALEATQYALTIGLSSMTDLIENGAGGIVGIILYESLKKVTPAKRIDAINLGTIIVASPFCLVAIVNTLTHIHLYL